ncbi:hypothetical protein EMEDMD4_1310054 [Sinorhizobium medicae]|uniref:Uncharacterized protein n=1 Tax=Sinorhizobium medicae TaxID=110321 RepID=A0A508WRE1_9HYPH|nr:hypothetical protein EMEDMD4_1310054 [Sinorhizobium medicae]
MSERRIDDVIGSKELENRVVSVSAQPTDRHHAVDHDTEGEGVPVGSEEDGGSPEVVHTPETPQAPLYIYGGLLSPKPTPRRPVTAWCGEVLLGHGKDLGHLKACELIAQEPLAVFDANQK